jgi:hypothetical protein
MSGANELPEALRARIDELARQEGDSLLEEALGLARAQVLEELTEAAAQSLRAQIGNRRSPAAVPRPVTREPTSGEELAWYVYGVIAADDAAVADGLPGIEPDHAATALVEGTVAAVVSRVRLDEFSEATLRTHLADMGWVEVTARAHEHTLELVRRRATVIPMRMCSVYRTEGGVREMLSREQNALGECLTELAGKAEWGVKVFADPRLRRTHSPAEPRGGSSGAAETSDGPGGVVSDDMPGAGTAYLARKREERDEAERVDHLIDEAARQIHDRLRATAADGRVIPPRQAEPGGPEMILNGVYLVPDDEQAEFHERVLELQSTFGSLGVELEPSGPWPAYNFVPGTIGAAW